MELLVMILVPFLLCSGALGSPYTDCGSAKGKVSGVYVSGCDQVDRCTLKRGTTASVSVAFQALTDTKTAKAVVHGVIGGVPLPFPVPNPDGCTNCGLTCPLKNEQNYNYTTTMDIKNSYPALSVDVKWELRDDDDQDLFCVLIPAQLQ